MEKCVDACVQELVAGEDITGCILTDKHGLCLAVAGKAKPECSGLIAAIGQQVSKLEPSLPHPVILLEADNRKCLIQQNGGVTAAIFKTSQA